MNGDKKERIRSVLEWIAVGFLLLLAFLFSLWKIEYSSNERIDALLKSFFPLLFSVPVAIWLIVRDRRGLFFRPQCWLCLLPCLLVAINNLPFCAYFTGKCSFAKVGAAEIVLFISYCLLVGVFEELVFRGLIFSFLAERFPKNRKGFLYAYFISSVLFGAAHLLNLLGGAGVVGTLMQVGYSTLIGGLCAFALAKTKNILCPAMIHALYNICGLLFDEPIGLGLGVAFDLPTVILTAIIGVAVGIFVLYSVFTYSEEERLKLYARMGI